MRFSSIDDAVAYVEQFALRPESERETLLPRERQAARFPHMSDLMAELGNPQDQFRVAHITGTSGKGSTATILDAIMRAAGQRTGLYTNPYITRPQERVQIAGAPIADEEFMACADLVAEAFSRIEARHPDRHPHLKQVWVALALVAFARAKVDLAVIEVGMGGRYDETNVVHPAVAVVTTVDFDHTEFLGETLLSIASHKAGIIKAGAPAITGVRDQAALAVVRHEAQLVGTTLDVLGADFAIADVRTDWDGTRLSYHDALGELADLRLALIGTHQATNAALAIRAARVITPAIDPATIRNGLVSAWLPGRFEVVSEHPYVVLDAAHNPEKMHALAQTLASLRVSGRLVLIFGALGTKAISAMLATLIPLSPQIIVTAPEVVGRVASPASATAEAARALGFSVNVADGPADALRLARAQATPNDLIVVTGSLFLLSQIRPLLVH